MMVVATVIFLGAMFLSMEKDEDGQWGFTPISVMAQGGESGTKSGTHSNLINSRGFSGVDGLYTIFNPPGANAGSASVFIDSTLGNLVWTKNSDNSAVGMGSATNYNISYQADYTYSGGIGTGNLVVNDGKVVTW